MIDLQKILDRLDSVLQLLSSEHPDINTAIERIEILKLVIKDMET